MHRPRVSVTGLLIAVVILAVVFSILGRSDRAVSELWNLVVFSIPPIGLLWVYGSKWTRARIGSVLASLFYLSSGLLVLAGLGAHALFLLEGFPFLLERIPWIPARDVVIFVTLGTTGLAMVIITGRAVWHDGAGRSFSVGFAAIGWPLLLCGLAPALEPQLPLLWTSELLHEAYWATLAGPAPPVPYLGPNIPDPGPGFGTWAAGPFLYWRFQFIGHCLISLAAATAGGLLARGLAASRHAPAAPIDEPSPAQPPSSFATPVGALSGTRVCALPGRNS